MDSYLFVSTKLNESGNEGNQDEEPKEIFDIKEESRHSGEKRFSGININNFEYQKSSNLNFAGKGFKSKGYSTLTFFGMSVEGELVKGEGPKKMMDIWGIRIKNMFYDKNFNNMILLVSLLPKFYLSDILLFQ